MIPSNGEIVRNPESEITNVLVILEEVSENLNFVCDVRLIKFNLLQIDIRVTLRCLAPLGVPSQIAPSTIA